VNPLSWEQSVNVANVLGVRSICIFNDYRERLVGSRMLQAQDQPQGRASDPAATTAFEEPDSLSA
jgi:hypothetical protein